MFGDEALTLEDQIAQQETATRFGLHNFVKISPTPRPFQLGHFTRPLGSLRGRASLGGRHYCRPDPLPPAPGDIWLRHPALNGQPAGVGWSSGRACVVNCECELSRVGPGDILVTKVAGPALSQILQSVAGVVRWMR